MALFSWWPDCVVVMGGGMRGNLLSLSLNCCVTFGGLE